MKKEEKPKLIFYAVLLLIPIMFFVFLELGLRLFNYGYNLSTWTNITETHYGLNPELARRYFFTVKNVPESIQDVFAVDKKPETYRVFVLGGSSAAGYPYMPLGAFSRYIRLRLEQNYPDKIIEVVNIGLTAVNSYTIRDLIPDVIEQKPDLILIYAGHNEYYGALGAGSMESLGQSRSVVNFLLSLNQFKTTQLIRDFIKFTISLFADNEKSQTGTLMSRMAENQKIEYDSDTFNLGIEQFNGNMEDIINEVKRNNIPIILSTLASNLKDLPPFIYDRKDSTKNAGLIFRKAEKSYAQLNYRKADSLFRIAKDLDQLRFRAPEKLNSIIKNLADKHNLPLVDIDSLLSLQSPNGIIGDNLMTDHLHLTLEGYQELGKLFYNTMNEMKFLPAGNPIYNFSYQDSIVKINFPFSELDSTIADYKLRILKNDWPFKTPKNSLPFNSIIKPTDHVDSAAAEVVRGNIDWHKAHLNLANYYIKKKDFSKFKNEMGILVFQYPIITEYYELLISELINQREYDEAFEYLVKNNRISENHFSTKWLGTIELSRKNYKSAINYLETSFKYGKNDAQVYYNLSGAYSQLAEYKTALEYIDKCLSINPNYLGANNLKKQLEMILSNNK